MLTDEQVTAAIATETTRRAGLAREIARTLAPLDDVTYTGFLRGRAAQWLQRTALVHRDRSWTYAGMFAAIDDAAAQLARTGVRPGTAVALLMDNSDHYVVWYLAILQLRAVAVPLNNRMVAREIAYILGNAQVGLVVSEAGYDALLAEADARTACLLVDPDTGAGLPPADAARHPQVRAATTSRSPDDGAVAPAAHDETRAAVDRPAALYYTSGTTGAPKGVVHTHRSLIACTLQCPDALECVFDELRALAVTPLFHIAAHVIFLPVLSLGGTLVVDTYRTDDTLALIERHAINAFFAVPSILLMMSDRAAELGCTLPGVRSLQFGAAPMPVSKLAQVRTLFPNAVFVHAMGQTESCGLLVTLPGFLAFERAGSVGFAIAGVQVAIFDENDREVPHGTVGELVARGPNVMAGYFRNPEASADTLRAGWLHTGDLGLRDADGLVTLVDRKKDMIIRGGENIYSTEVEHALMRHASVAQAAVIGTPDPLFGERVTAFVVPKPEANPPTLAEIQAHCRRELAGYKVPAELWVVDLMPATATGKVQKGGLRLLARQLRDGAGDF